MHGGVDVNNAVGKRAASTQRWSSDGHLLWESIERDRGAGRALGIGRDGAVVAVPTYGNTSEMIRYVP